METSTNFAYDNAIAGLEQGLVPACVPIVYEGERGVYTKSGSFDATCVNTDEEALALAMVAIIKTYEEAFEAGAFPLR